MEKLLKDIEGLIIDKSLSLDVIEIVRKIQAEHSVTMQENKDLKLSLEDKNKVLISREAQISDLKSEKEILRIELDVYKAREAEFVESEHSHALKDKDVASSNRVVSEIKEVISMVFKNTITREGINKSTSEPVVVNGYVQYQSTSENYNKDTKTLPDEGK